MAMGREQPTRRATNATATTTRASTASRSGLRQPTKRVSTLRHHTNMSGSTTSSAAMATRIGRGGAVSPAESMMSVATSATGTKRKDHDFDADGAATGDETNINVVVRCRGRNEREVRENSAVVVTTDGAKGKVVELSMGPNALSNKTYNFDRVFSPAADQSMIFDDVVKPILDQMLTGFNCTIFAYGQTGTGKTYTMSGDMSETLGLLTDAAGIIPRVLQSLFHKLDADESDSIVRCSFIELYNEELRDLLSADADSSGSAGSGGTKLKIYDDNSRRGHATTVVQGMEERHIASAAEGIKRLQEGSVRRQVAATKCNDLSSRSHTVFTITVQTKHMADSGEDFYITGKLNLVDLAGSENIQRSGAENKRAAEAGLINKSLLTLGRVINALVDRTAHVPYRESKLTRLLQDSLGGRTKTCIIATISTAKSNLEETISTLDYAFRAKNIRNKPQVNQLINKKTLLRELTADIEKLKSELIVTRQRNGVYLANDAYEEMTVQSESRRILAEEQAAKIEMMENNLRHKLQELLDLTSNFMGLKKEHEGTRARLDETSTVLAQTETVLAATRKTLAEETWVRQAHEATEAELAAIGSDLISTLARTVDDIDGLRAKNRRKSDLQGVNRNVWAGSQAQVADVTRMVEDRILGLRASQARHISAIAQRMKAFVAAGQESLASTEAQLDASLAAFEGSRSALLAQQDAAKDDMDAVLAEVRAVRSHIQQHVGESLQAIASAAERIADDVLSELGTFHSQLHASYSTLGKDCKSIFEDLLQHMAEQRSESEGLRRQAEAASQAAVRSSAAVALQIEEAVAEERRLAAEDRQRLLAQIGSLITAQAEAQEARLAARADSIRERMLQSSASLEGDMAAYGTGMDAWNTAADGFVQDVSKSRDALKSRLQDDWTTANDHSTSIQNTAKSVHAETVRVVDEQMQDLDAQMQGLDSLVTRAASQNDEHRAQHAASVAQISEAVTASHADAASRAHDSLEQTEGCAGEVEADVEQLSEGWAPTETSLCQPLRDLQACVSGTTIREYVPTGETPEKTQYRYPVDLPRTVPHEELIRGVAADDVLDHETTPTKAPPAAVFSDPSPSDVAQSPPRPVSPARTSMSLREVDPNLTVGSLLFDAAASTLPLQADEIVVGGSSGDKDSSSRMLPLFRRSTRQPPAKQARTTKGTVVVALDGVENVPLTAFSRSASRRRSPRLH